MHDLGQFRLISVPRYVFVVMVEMSNCTGLATVQRKHMRIVRLFGSVVTMVVHSGCGHVN